MMATENELRDALSLLAERGPQTEVSSRPLDLRIDHLPHPGRSGRPSRTGSRPKRFTILAAIAAVVIVVVTAFALGGALRSNRDRPADIGGNDPDAACRSLVATLHKSEPVTSDFVRSASSTAQAPPADVVLPSSAPALQCRASVRHVKTLAVSAWLQFYPRASLPHYQELLASKGWRSLSRGGPSSPPGHYTRTYANVDSSAEVAVFEVSDGLAVVSAQSTTPSTATPATHS